MEIRSPGMTATTIRLPRLPGSGIWLKNKIEGEFSSFKFQGTADIENIFFWFVF